MTLTYLTPKEEGEDEPDIIDERVESLPNLEESIVLPKFLPESKSSIRLIRLFLSYFRLGFLLVLDKNSLY